MGKFELIPVCPNCEAQWTEGPATRDYPGDVRIVACPSCSKVIGVVPVPVLARG